MKKILQINVTANWGSHGKIAENIGELIIKNGYDSWIAYGRGNPKSKSNLIRIGNTLDIKFHGFQSRMFDNHGLASKKTTTNFINKIKEIQPDLIHLHNIHGYFLNYKILFNYLKEWGRPVVWTLHDCWSYTGHCSHYTLEKCYKWREHCYNCPQLNQYPKSLLVDRSIKNFKEKKISFVGLKNLTIVAVSDWLATELTESFLNNYPIKVIKNGIDTEIFKKELISKNSANKLILGVASVWSERKGLGDFIKLRKFLPEEYGIILVGLSKRQIKSLPVGITGIERTENINELVKLYNKADIFVNPSVEETFGLTTVEALACGTPAIVYNSTALSETIDEKTGLVIDKGDVIGMANGIMKIFNKEILFDPNDCRKRAEIHFNQETQFNKYINLYESLILKC